MAKENNALLFIAPLLFLAAAGGATAAKILPEILTGDSPTDFVKRYGQDALDIQKKTGVPALITLAQGGVESKWGVSAPGNNFFGIKASPDWKGSTQKLKTWECGKTGNPVTDGIKDEVIETFKPGDAKGNASCNAKGMYSYSVYGVFRKYDSARDSFSDHAKFLQRDRYKKAFEYTNNPNQFAIEIAKAGYATAPTYAEMLIKVMDLIKVILMPKIWDASSEAKILKLHPNVREKAIDFINAAQKQGILLRVVSGYRTYPEQLQLYAQGRTAAELKAAGVTGVTARPDLLKVTNAKPGESSHNFGTAIDVVEVKNGKVIGYAKEYPLSQWNKIGAIGKSVGFAWGGDWTGFKDRPHFEMNFGKSFQQLRDLVAQGKTTNGYVNFA